MDNLLIQHIALTPGVRGGKPCIAGTRIAVADIAIVHLKLGQTVDEIANDYNLPLADIYAALTYYYDHQDEIERQLVEDDAFVEAFRQQNPSKLKLRLSQFKDG